MRMLGFYFFRRAFFLLLPFPERLRLIDFGERSVPFDGAGVVVVGPFVVPPPIVAFLGGIFSLLSRSAPSLPFARKCC